ncbi:MAG: hypothetical protein QM820_33815 [Minicystis sp.]
MPAFITRTPSGARSLATVELSTKLDRLVFEDLLLARNALHTGMPLGEVFGLVRLRAVPGDEIATAALDGAHHAVDVVMAHAADSELDVVLRRRRLLRGHHFVHDVAAFTERRQPRGCHHRARATQEHPPIELVHPPSGANPLNPSRSLNSTSRSRPPKAWCASPMMTIPRWEGRTRRAPRPRGC